MELDIGLLDIEADVLMEKYDQVGTKEKGPLNQKILDLQKSMKKRKEALHSPSSKWVILHNEEYVELKKQANDAKVGMFRS